MSINPISSFSGCGAPGPDAEEKAIMRRLLFVYGVWPSGNKTVDREKLRQCEIKQFMTEKIISSKYIMLSKNEQKQLLEKIQKEKFNNQPQENDGLKNDDIKNIGATIQGEQIYQAILMNQNKKKKKLK